MVTRLESARINSQEGISLRQSLKGVFVFDVELTLVKIQPGLKIRISKSDRFLMFFRAPLISNLLNSDFRFLIYD